MKLGPNKMGHCYKPALYHSYKAKKRKDKTRWIGNVHFEYDIFNLADEYDGRVLNAKIKEGKIDEPFYISQRVKPFGEQKKFTGKPLSSCFVSKGCVLEYFDGVVLIQNHEMINLCDRPVNSVRSYLNSNNYRDIVSIVDDDSISLNAIFNIDDIKSMPAFPKTTVWHNTSSNEVVYGDHNEELPF